MLLHNKVQWLPSATTFRLVYCTTTITDDRKIITALCLWYFISAPHPLPLLPLPAPDDGYDGLHSNDSGYRAGALCSRSPSDQL
jgi:hypothetical protein